MSDVVDRFSPVEWSVLTELPVRIVASAVTVDESSSLGVLLEQVTGLTQLSNGAMQRPDSKLVQAIFEQYKDEGQGETNTLELSEQWVENLVPETLERARQAAEILATRVSNEEALDYKSWLLETAEAVCAASKTGGFLGIGGTRVTESEEQFLRDLSAAFGIDPPEEAE